MSYITGLVLVKNDIQYVNSDNSVGSIQQIITPDLGGRIDCDAWAIPVNYGVYSGWKFQPYNPTNAVESIPPTPSSVAVTKVSAINTSDFWYVLGTSTQFITAANGGTALPIVWPAVSHSLPLLPVCTVINGTLSNGNNTLTLGAPTLLFGENYFPFGFFNGFSLPAATANGYANMTTLLAFLNTATTNSGTAAAPIYAGGWAVVGTWTSTADFLTVIATQAPGTGNDIFCGNILAVHPSF